MLKLSKVANLMATKKPAKSAVKPAAKLVEWQYAVTDWGEAGAAFLSSQGDERNAQKDILCDSLDYLCPISAFLIGNRKVKETGVFTTDITFVRVGSDGAKMPLVEGRS